VESASGGDVGAEGMVTKLANWWSPRTKYKRSKNAVAVMSTVLTFGTTVLKLLVQSPVGSPCVFPVLSLSR